MYWYRGFFDNGMGQYSGVREKYSFFLNEQSKDGFKFYFLFSFVFKNSISTTIIFIFSSIFLLKKKKLLDEEKLLFGIFIFLIFIFSISKINLGYRHGILADPFTILISSYIFSIKKFGKIFIPLSVFGFVSVISSFPHTISYINNLVSEKDKFHLFRSSNIEWGQDDFRAKKFAKFLGKKSEKKVYIYSTFLDLEKIAQDSDSYILIGSNSLSGHNIISSEKTKILRGKIPIYVLFGSWYVFEI